ncbi:MAG: hybrid sensor histidine kinase/response regulator [Burkholderiales bacterium]
MPPQKVRFLFSRIPLGRALVALGIVLVAINVASAVWDANKARERTERRTQRELANITRVLAEQTAASLDAVDVILRDLVRTGGASEVARDIPRLREEFAHVPTIATVLVLDAAGRVVARTGEMPALEPDLARHVGFAAHRRSRSDTLHLSEPYPTGLAGEHWRVLLSRRLDRRDGAFDGVVVAAIEAEVFDRLYRSIDLGQGSFISLLTDGGMFLSRVPGPLGIRGKEIATARGMAEVGKTGRFDGWSTSPVTGEPVLLSALAVRSFPLVVVSGSSGAAVHAAWRDEAWQIFDRTLLTSAAMLALIALAAWGLARRERALAGSWRRYQAMIEHSSDALVLTRPLQGGIHYASPAMERMLGYAAEELRGREIMELVHPDTLETALRMRGELLSSPGKVSVDELRMRHKDGTWRWVELTRKNLLDEPAVRAVVMNFRDTDERKHAEAERARLEQRLRQAEKMEAVGRLAGGIAHDFNNLLGGILGYAELLAENAPAGSPLRRYAGNVLTGATRASGLVDQILSYSRSQRGTRVPVDLGAVVGETLELVRGSLASSIALHIDLARSLYVVGDATQLHQVTMNLCTNAMHAMANGGTLRVALESVDVAAERALAHSMLRTGSYARLTVEDSGSGMDEATLARMFEPFFTTKEVGKGTGLGLSLVYGIVTDSGGAIDVESRPGRGSRFAIYLPRIDAPAIAAGAATVPAARGNGERILVVDDEQALVAVGAEILKKLGYEAVGCHDGAAALAAFDVQQFDAAIVDEVMPGMTGTQLARTLRRRRTDLPVILVSGYTGPMLSERALAAGVTEILKKPVQTREIAAALARALGRGPLEPRPLRL